MNLENGGCRITAARDECLRCCLPRKAQGEGALCLYGTVERLQQVIRPTASLIGQMSCCGLRKCCKVATMPRCSRRLWTAFAALVGVGVCHGFTSVVSRWPSSTAACRRGTFGVESRRQPNKHLVPPLRCAFNEEGVGKYSRAGLQKIRVVVGSTDLQNAALMVAALASFAAIVMYADPDLIPALRDKCSSAHFLHFELQAAKDNGLQAFTCFSVSDLICQYGIKAEKEGDDGKAVSSETSFAHLDVFRALRAGVLGIFINACGYGFFISHLDQVYPHEVCILADTVSCTLHCLFHLSYAHVRIFCVHTAKLTLLDNSHLLCSCGGSTK